MGEDDEALSAQEIGRRFIDGFNRRDADALVALCHPRLEFIPTLLAREQAVYRGHDELRRWVAGLVASDAEHEVRVLDVRELDADRFVVLTEVLIGGEAMTRSAMVAALEDGLIVHVKAYLSDEQTLIRVGVLPPRDG